VCVCVCFACVYWCWKRGQWAQHYSHNNLLVHS